MFIYLSIFANRGLLKRTCHCDDDPYDSLNILQQFLSQKIKVNECTPDLQLVVRLGLRVLNSILYRGFCFRCISERGIQVDTSQR